MRYLDAKTFLFISKIINELREIISDTKPKIIYTHAFEGGHIDHDVANYCTVKAVAQLGLKAYLFEFPEYSAYDLFFIFPFKMRNYPPTLFTAVRKLTDVEYKTILKMWDIYKSQKIPLGYYISFISGNKTTFGYEYLRPIPKYDYLKKPPNYRNIAYGRYLRNIKFTDFVKYVRKYEEEKPF